MNTDLDQPTTTGRFRLVAAAIAATALAAVTTTGTAAALSPGNPVPWSQCAYADHPVAADLGGLLPVDFVPPLRTQAALLGETEVGTDCSFYDLSV